jgi:hypothetical protein
MIKMVTAAELVETGEKIDTKGRKIADQARRQEVLSDFRNCLSDRFSKA